MTFTDKKPVTPGVYWFKQSESDEPTIAFIQCFEGRACTNLTGLWSSRLVPVEEIEKAYSEGQHHEYTGDDYENSRARRVVEGKESP